MSAALDGQLRALNAVGGGAPPPKSSCQNIQRSLSQSSLKSLFKSSSGFEKKHQMFWQLCLFAQNCDLLGGNRFS
jgi:hypothetical protein